MSRLTVNQGDKYGRLTIIIEKEQIKDTRRFLCKCDCGNEAIVALRHLRNGHTKSCGCWNIEINSLTHRTHNLSYSRIYDIWANMINRCSYVSNTYYHNYGGRGISVCERWKIFINFYEDMKESYESHLTIDRINNDGNYEKENCKWSTRAEQNKNRRKRK